MRTSLLVAVACLGAAIARAEIALPDVFADHMVVQRGEPVPVWGRATPGAMLQVEFAGRVLQARTDADGKWSAEFPALDAGGPHVLRVGGDGEAVVTDILAGDVWLCSGQSNMNFRMAPNPPWSEGVLDYENEIAAATVPGLRIFEVITDADHVPREDAHGRWRVSSPEAVRYMSAVAYYFARRVHEAEGVPVGVIVAARGATGIRSWMPREALERFPALRPVLTAEDRKIAQTSAAIDEARALLPEYRQNYLRALATHGRIPSLPEAYQNYQYKPARLYNAMVAPLARTPVRGFVWYQGEGDSRSAEQYGAWFRALIESWRETWRRPDAPFLFVQLAGYDPVRARGLDPAEIGLSWAELRAAQASVLDLPGTAMAVAADVGDPLNIHPRDKRTVGERLARAALAVSYDRAVAYRGPALAGVERDAEALRLTFLPEAGAGLRITGDARALTGFELAGTDGVFHPATAMAGPGGVRVSRAGLARPVAVRYGWANAPELSLHDTNGLPVAPFVRSVD